LKKVKVKQYDNTINHCDVNRAMFCPNGGKQYIGNASISIPIHDGDSSRSGAGVKENNDTIKIILYTTKIWSSEKHNKNHVRRLKQGQK